MSHIIRYLIELLIEACSVCLLVGCSGVPSDVRVEPECMSVNEPTWRTGPLCYECRPGTEKPNLCISASGHDSDRVYFCCNMLPDGGPNK